MAKQRLDILLVEKNLCTSRALAQRLIQAGEVTVNGRIIDKVGTEVDVDGEITIKERSRFVSRGGEKLAKALDTFNISVAERVCLDAGISTGGFTDCLLQAGAKLVYGVDVGYGQVDWKLRNDARVILLERTNIRHLKPEVLYKEFPLDSLNSQEVADFIVVDVSFISVTKILAVLWELSQPPREMVLLVKPQFEVGKNRVGKKGVVRDSHDHADAIFQILETAQKVGWRYQGLTWSPITGPAGNVEYLLWLAMASQEIAPNLVDIQKLTQSAVNELK
ncbi:TlyA family RNA methyltransferase [Calothrix sp. UHCC 0171]|uniref:TlyA family RNA methyltransferase n=1 Tax=Calothrix sp. UHCC 0171 TaxID=3110245 RepID=UPI002B1FC8E5|nr:TlyA family RNA methyltransferase [Calothrix sp. UHCC 0171]MEA5571148.1 TlyA family RNA methyltransferase [Calothrix sp. UHCC 0171]